MLYRMSQEAGLEMDSKLFSGAAIGPTGAPVATIGGPVCLQFGKDIQLFAGPRAWCLRQHLAQSAGDGH